MKFFGALIIGVAAWAGVSAYRRMYPNAFSGSKSPDFNLPDVLKNYQDQNPKV